MELTKIERLSLYNQYQILSKLSKLQGNEYETKEYERMAKSLSQGFTLEYNELALWDEELSVEGCELVWDILDLYSIIQASYNELDNPKMNRTAIEFKGFDGNYEPAYHAYCRFILVDKGRFANICGDAKDYEVSGRINSHLSLVPRYRAMLRQWKKMGKPMSLTEEQINELINLPRALE